MVLPQKAKHKSLTHDRLETDEFVSKPNYSTFVHRKHFYTLYGKSQTSQSLEFTAHRALRLKILLLRSPGVDYGKSLSVFFYFVSF